MVFLTSTGTKVYVATMTTIFYGSYNYLEENLNNLKSLKPNSYLGDNFAYLCAAILVDDKCLESTVEFNTYQLSYIIQIFEDPSDYIFLLWEIHKYKKVT